MNAKRFVKCNEGAGEKGEGVEVSQVWCMDYSDNLIAVGCSDGQIEFWEGTTGKLRVRFKIILRIVSKRKLVVSVSVVLSHI